MYHVCVGLSVTHTGLSLIDKLGFEPLSTDGCLFRGANNALLILYVDDICIAAPTVAGINAVVDKLGGIFELKRLGEAPTFLGYLVVRFGTVRITSFSSIRPTTSTRCWIDMPNRGSTMRTPPGFLASLPCRRYGKRWTLQRSRTKKRETLPRTMRQRDEKDYLSLRCISIYAKLPFQVKPAGYDLPYVYIP